jgi:predicted nucleic acid-binding protein
MYLLDTDILIYSLKGKEAVVRRLESHQYDPLKISVISLMELYYGAHKSEKVTANLSRVRWIENAFDVLPVDVSIAGTFGMIKSNLEFQGTPLDDFDLIIAATALASNLRLVTNNERHFSRVEGLKLENWARPI